MPTEFQIAVARKLASFKPEMQMPPYSAHAPHAPLLLPIHAALPKPADQWPTPPTSVSSPSVTMTDDDEEDSHAVTMLDVDDETTPSAPAYTFFTLPAELRNIVYEELLLSDSAFRLGHQGPYSHESRRQLYPQIMRTNKQVCHEAAAILYGSNAFYLGPIGHKPTYSASFITSIGSHNAQMIRTLVAHSTNPARLTQWYLRNWVTSFGLDPSRVKVLAVSLSLPRKNPDLHPQHPHHQHHHHANGSTLTAVPVVGSTGAYVLTVPVNLAAIPTQGGGANGTGVVVTSNPTNTGTMIQVDVNMSEMKNQGVLETDFDIAARQMEGWLERRPRKDVERLIAVKNTDLRADDNWLVYVSPAMKQKAGL